MTNQTNHLKLPIFSYFAFFVCLAVKKQNKAKLLRFQSNIKGPPKKQTQSDQSPNNHPERSEGSLCAKQSQIELPNHEKRNEPNSF